MRSCDAARNYDKTLENKLFSYRFDFKEIKGMVASMGKVRGRVVIIKDYNENDEAKIDSSEEVKESYEDKIVKEALQKINEAKLKVEPKKKRGGGIFRYPLRYHVVEAG